MDRDTLLERMSGYTGVTARLGDSDTKVAEAETPSGFAIKPSRGARSVPIGEAGMANLLDFAGVPAKLAEKLEPQTLGKVATQALTSKRADGTYTMLTKGGEVMEFAPPSQTRNIPATRVVDNIAKGIPSDVEFRRFLDLPRYTLRIETVGEQEHAVKVGDLVRAGTVTQFSPLGLTVPSVEAFNERLVCTNGMTARDFAQEWRHAGGRGGAGEGDDIWQFFRKANRDAYAAFGRTVERYDELAQTSINPEDRGMILEALMREGGIRGDLAAAVRNDAITSPPEDEWDMVNLISRVTSHVLEDPREIVRAQRAAAGFVAADEHSRTCPSCSRAQ